MSEFDPGASDRQAWNAGRKVGAKRALKPKHIWGIRFFLDQHRRLRDRALFDLAIDSKLRGCDVVRLKIGDLISGGQVRTRAVVVQQKTSRPVQFELLSDARASLLAWLQRRGGTLGDIVFPSRIDHTNHLSTRQYARLLDEWVTGIDRRVHASLVSIERTRSALEDRPAVFSPPGPASAAGRGPLWRPHRRGSSTDSASPCRLLHADFSCRTATRST
jgi:integrase